MIKKAVWLLLIGVAAISFSGCGDEAPEADEAKDKIETEVPKD